MTSLRRRARPLVAAVTLLAAGPAWAQGPADPRPGPNDVLEREGDVTRNWTLRLFEVRGVGVPPTWATSQGQARALAEEAARAVAQRNMLQAILETRIDSRTFVRNRAVGNADIETAVTGALKNAFERGVKEFDDGRVEVTLGLYLRGELANALLGPAPEPRRPLVAAPAPVAVPPALATPPPSAAPPAAPAPQATAPAPPPAIYSGLVVDARGLGVRPAMAPRLVSEAGQEIFGDVVVDRRWVVQHGMAWYLKDLAAAQTSDRVAHRPLTIKGLKADGPNRADVIISDSDAQILLGAKQHLSFLQEARVVIVVD